MPTANFDWTPDYYWTANTNTAMPTAKTWIKDCCSTPYITQNQLDDILKKLHKVISEHVKLDITEEEFVNILKE